MGSDLNERGVTRKDLVLLRYKIWMTLSRRGEGGDAMGAITAAQQNLMPEWRAGAGANYTSSEGTTQSSGPRIPLLPSGVGQRGAEGKSQIMTVTWRLQWGQPLLRKH